MPRDLAGSILIIGTGRFEVLKKEEAGPRVDGLPFR